MVFIQDFRTLQQVTTPDLCNTFNAAFSDYIVPLHLTPSILEQKMQGENLLRDYSIGAFAGQQLGGFILHAVDNKEHPTVLYNGGTGIIPAYRGQHLVQKMYDQFIPVYQDKGIRKIVLEVISTNLPAIKAYTNTGFHKTRTIHSFKGTVQTHKTPVGISLKENKTPDWSLLASFMDMVPTWSNTMTSIQREGPYTVTWEAVVDGQTAGYISVHKDTRRIRSMAIHPQFRRKGIGSALLQYAADQLKGPLSIINIDEHFPEIDQFLQQAGLMRYLSQYEMEIEL
ncbi:GNAT family N-acetyltransferase [Chitinophaga arvensicola]|uniref:Ribosomal protein S18 acetylase RimI n=1 Tax=Chitinophaga arvensicola TaxID=29529 RepID=A0A1I0QR02_9BACT|nr:GNAT family N-acetyltransferase [Chitinophaga arvensicola]SEW29940.1 Ribosomal protein S18 acetylase RimI [Chitinophaga arvensicola]